MWAHSLASAVVALGMLVYPLRTETMSGLVGVTLGFVLGLMRSTAEMGVIPPAVPVPAAAQMNAPHVRTP